MPKLPRSACRLLAVLAVFLTVGMTWALAQATGEAADLTAWEEVAVRAEAALESGEASDNALEELRSDVASWRARLLAAQATNEARIATLKSQIDALGPTPPEGETEPPEIAARRAELNQRLAQLEVPRRAADEAYSRAGGLIAEIDRVLRARQANQILELGPSPLNPALWPQALVALGTTISEVSDEFRKAWRNEVRRAEFGQNLPMSVLLALVAIGLVTQGRKFMERLTVRAETRPQNQGRDVLVFAVSLGQLFLPVLGLVALVSAANTTGLLGPRNEALVNLLPVMGLSIFGARWLGTRVFPRPNAASAPIELSNELRREGRWYAVTLGLLLAISYVLRVIAGFEEQSAETIFVIAYPTVVIAGLVLFRLGQFLVRAAGPEKSEDEGSGFRSALIRLSGRALMLVGIGGPVLAGIGYFGAAEAIMFPTVLTLALVAFLAVLHAPIRDAYALISGKDEKASGESLFPVLVLFLLTLASLPAVAVIWGARPSGLLEIWARFREGLSFGDTRIAPGDFVTFAVVFAIGYAVTRLVQGTLRSTILPKTRLDTGGRNAITSGVGYLGIFIAALAAITAAGINLSSLAIVAGALSVGIGFGLQNVVSNFVSGIILLIERPISEGDWVEVGGQMGIVRDISVRSTRIETFDRTDVIVPNADFVSGQVTNWTRGNLTGRVTISVGVAYTSDSKKAESILREVCESHPLVSMNPEPKVFFRRFGTDSLEFDCFCILRDVNYKLQVHSDLNHEIHRRFREEGIEIPFAQRDVWLRNPETLAAARAPSASWNILDERALHAAKEEDDA